MTSEFEPNDLQLFIRDIVSKNSGGIKFTALLTRVITESQDRWAQVAKIDGDKFLDRLFAEVGNDPTLGIFRYSWDMGGGELREKHFVYEIH